MPEWSKGADLRSARRKSLRGFKPHRYHLFSSAPLADTRFSLPAIQHIYNVSLPSCIKRGAVPNDYSILIPHIGLVWSEHISLNNFMLRGVRLHHSTNSALCMLTVCASRQSWMFARDSDCGDSSENSLGQHNVHTTKELHIDEQKVAAVKDPAVTCRRWSDNEGFLGPLNTTRLPSSVIPS